MPSPAGSERGRSSSEATPNRALSELAGTPGEEAVTPRERGLLEWHDGEERAFLANFVEGAVVELDGLGPTRFCHGSPRSDEDAEAKEFAG